ncbi:uncharacterized protein [Panulirus ornatus]|uniref:uncharacterized protein n=1 Tax=Panulirus ornatus TaxID=150431 RepID=UPI003A8C1F2F
MRYTVVFVCLLSMTLAVPEGNGLLEESNDVLQEKRGVDIWPSLSRLLDRFKDSIIHSVCREKRWDLITILRLLGFTEDNLINAMEYVENIAAEIADEMTLEEKFKFENAGMDIVLMLNNGNFNFETALGDLYTIKTAIYPHLNENLQKFLDILEQGIITILKIFGIA